MTQTYEQEYRETLATLKEDGFAVTLIKKGTGGDDEYDDNGDLIPFTPDELFDGYGITTQFKAFYIAQGIAKAGDCQLMFCPGEMTPEYIALHDSLSGDSNAKVFALVDGKEWRVKGGSELKITSTQIFTKLHLTR